MNRAPMPATNEPDMADAALAPTTGVEVLAGLEPVAVERLLEDPVATGVETAVAVALLPTGPTAPWDGERGVPDETREPPEMAVEREEAELEAEDPVADEDALLEVEVETLEQDRS